MRLPKRITPASISNSVQIATISPNYSQGISTHPCNVHDAANILSSFGMVETIYKNIYR